MSRPVRAAPLVGRLVERGELLDRLASDRLVSLIGPGGAGKTRLALDVMDAVSSPAIFVALDQATTAAEVVEPSLGRALIHDALLRFLLKVDYQLEPGGDYAFTVRARF